MSNLTVVHRTRLEITETLLFSRTGRYNVIKLLIRLKLVCLEMRLISPQNSFFEEKKGNSLIQASKSVIFNQGGMFLITLF